jgi:hypothetical protein
MDAFEDLIYGAQIVPVLVSAGADLGGVFRRSIGHVIGQPRSPWPYVLPVPRQVPTAITQGEIIYRVHR